MCEEHSGDSHQTSYKEIPQEIDVEKLMDEDVVEMTLETDVDDDARGRKSQSQMP